MPNFTHDWFTPHSQYLWDATKELVGKPELQFLEIGCFEGRATVWFLDHFPTSRITCVDTFGGSREHEEAGIDFCAARDRFNLNIAPYPGRVELYICTSFEYLASCKRMFDLIYVDGSHMAADVLADAVLSHPLLKTGGFLAFDDYGWGLDLPDYQRPAPAIDAFIQCQGPNYQVVHKGYRVVLKKNE